jgi:AcrR family transcriptional regulator
MSTAAIPRRPGRPRDAAADDAIVNAATQLIAEAGYAGLTVDAVAARAGVGKATIYRRWPSKDALLLHCMQCVASEFDLPDTGSVREDLVATLRRLAEHLARPEVRQVLPAVVAQAAVDPSFGDLLHGFVRTRRAHTRAMLERGVARGELRADVDLDVLTDLIGGPLFYRLLVSGSSVSATEADAQADLVLGGALAHR